MTDVCVRPLCETDRPGWLRLWAAYLAFYQQDLPEEVTDTLFERLLGDGGHDGLVAEQGERLIGFAHYLPHASTWAIAPTCYLEDLFVDATVRGGGVGRKLIEAVYQAAEVKGCTNVYWHTHDDNHQARQLYDKIGVLSNFVRYDKRKWEEKR
ncbi:GNAT family N-acetyltransferase [Roseibium sp. RKSG952]|uniref:GNAT family N-acetyltransferase n=1 Tax=Roseibium sp. RKSG952 TaxID=2529384 RepID=UPI0012BBDE0A|nr:GNAT family N-acetyltransferase [Roseibium sp. RKSG952]MTH96340.1 GNAT family N-acetyltransferase [Roseibium sp. RKSG952]